MGNLNDLVAFQMTTTACVWKRGSLIVEIATFPLAAAWAYEESRKHSRRDAAAASS